MFGDKCLKSSRYWVVILMFVGMMGLSDGVKANFHGDDDRPEFMRQIGDPKSGQALAAEIGCLACHATNSVTEEDAPNFDRDLVERLLQRTGKAPEILAGEDFYLDFRHTKNHVVFTLYTADLMDLLAFGDALSRMNNFSGVLDNKPVPHLQH